MTEVDFQAIQERLWELEKQIQVRDDVIDSYSLVIQNQAKQIAELTS